MINFLLKLRPSRAGIWRLSTYVDTFYNITVILKKTDSEAPNK